MNRKTPKKWPAEIWGKLAPYVNAISKSTQQDPFLGYTSGDCIEIVITPSALIRINYGIPLDDPILYSEVEVKVTRKIYPTAIDTPVIDALMVLVDPKARSNNHHPRNGRWRGNLEFQSLDAVLDPVKE
ncbi:MAG: hypothetical protein AABX33_07110 [Nanoarchaeota archaeon]